MHSLKRLPVIFRRKPLGFWKGKMFENLPSNHVYQIGNSTIFREERDFQSVERRFCTRSNEELLISEKGSFGIDAESDQSESNAQLFEEIASGDAELLKKLKLLEFEVELLREEEDKVPSKMTKLEWESLCKLQTASQRRKYLAFLRLNELKDLSNAQKTIRSRQTWEHFKDDLGFHYYGLCGHTMFMRVYEKDMYRLLRHRVRNAQLLFLLDCSYQSYMNERNTKACAKQIYSCFSEIKFHRYPAQLKLCNFDENGELAYHLPRYMSGMLDFYSDEFFKESYLEMYPREKLVYLTPHTRDSLDVFDPSVIYIIGAFVDKGCSEKASLAKAKENNIKMARLPIDEYTLWKQGTKSLPLNLLLKILLDMAFFDDWHRAFKNLPPRCVGDNE